MEKSKRIIYLDMLKIISCIFVVVIHVTSPGFYDMNFNSIKWKVNLLFNMMGRFAVPAFVMVSGALFLNSEKNIDIKRLWKKNILHLTIIYVLWTIIYSIYAVYNKGLKLNLINVIKNSVKSSYYHLWFIPMLIGLYVMIPFLKEIVKDKKLVKYFIIIFLLLKIIPYTAGLFQVSMITSIINRIDVPILSFTGYFILGYYINTFEIKEKNRKILYLCGIISFIIGIVGTILFCKYKQKPVESLCREYSITTFFMSIAIFTFMKYIFKDRITKDKYQKMIIHFSKMSLGIYLIHALFRDIIKNQMGISFTNIYNLPLVLFVIIIVSYISTYILSKIPFLKRTVIL